MRLSVYLWLFAAFLVFLAPAEISASETSLFLPAAANSEPALFRRAPVRAPALTTTQQFEMLNLVNNLRAANGAPALKLDSRIIRVAQAQADYQASRCIMTHGEPLRGRVRRIAGLSNLAIAENVAAKHPNVREVFNGWKNSRGHFRNMVNPTYNVMGAGYSVNKGCYNRKIFWSQNFARVSSISAVKNPNTSKPQVSSTVTKPNNSNN